jgi:hypothetical protein
MKKARPAPPPLPAITKHYGPIYAVRMARWIGYREPLIYRLRDPTVSLDLVEREYLADVLAEWPKPKGTSKSEPKGTSKSVVRRRNQLRAAAVYLEFLNAGGKPGKGDAAVKAAADRCTWITERTIRRNLSYAKSLGDGEWWTDASRLARKRKLEALHRMY